MVIEFLSDPPFFLAAKKIIQWAALVPLYGNRSLALVGPFHFAAINESNRVRQRVSQTTWETLARMCNAVGISPPTFGPMQHHPMPPRVGKNSKLKRKRL